MNFERGKSPKEALGMGLFHPRTFSSMDEAQCWLMQNHTAILGLESLCFPNPTPEQFATLRQYVKDYIGMDHGEIWSIDVLVDGVAQLYRELHQVKGHWNGKFI